MAKKAKKVTRTRAPSAPTVAVKVSGGKLEYIKARTLGEVKKAMGVLGYQATVDGNPESDNDLELTKDSMVILTAPVKGAK